MLLAVIEQWPPLPFIHFRQFRSTNECNLKTLQVIPFLITIFTRTIIRKTAPWNDMRIVGNSPSNQGYCVQRVPETLPWNGKHPEAISGKVASLSVMIEWTNREDRHRLPLKWALEQPLFNSIEYTDRRNWPESLCYSNWALWLQIACKWFSDGVLRQLSRNNSVQL